MADDWRQHVLNMTKQAVAGFPPATAADFGPITFYGSRTPDDPADRLDGLPLVKWTAIRQRALDLHGSIPSFEAIREVSLEKLSHANRISALVKARGDGGPGLADDAPLVQSERQKLQRAEQELARLQALQEIRTAKWNAAGQLSATSPTGCSVAVFRMDVCSNPSLIRHCRSC